MCKTYLFVCLFTFRVLCSDYVGYLNRISFIIIGFHIYRCFYTHTMYLAIVRHFLSWHYIIVQWVFVSSCMQI